MREVNSEGSPDKKGVFTRSDVTTLPRFLQTLLLLSAERTVGARCPKPLALGTVQFWRSSSTHYTPNRYSQYGSASSTKTRAARFFIPTRATRGESTDERHLPLPRPGS